MRARRLQHSLGVGRPATPPELVVDDVLHDVASATEPSRKGVGSREMGIGKEIIMSGLEPHTPLLKTGKNVTFALNMHLGWARRAELAAVPTEPAIVRTIGMVHEFL